MISSYIYYNYTHDSNTTQFQIFKTVKKSLKMFISAKQKNRNVRAVQIGRLNLLYTSAPFMDAKNVQENKKNKNNFLLH